MLDLVRLRICHIDSTVWFWSLTANWENLHFFLLGQLMSVGLTITAWRVWLEVLHVLLEVWGMVLVCYALFQTAYMGLFVRILASVSKSRANSGKLLLMCRYLYLLRLASHIHSVTVIGMESLAATVGGILVSITLLVAFCVCQWRYAANFDYWTRRWGPVWGLRWLYWMFWVWQW